MKTKLIASVLLASVALTGCENPKQAVGALGGGALGGWAGSGIGKGRGRLVSTAAGAVAGALLGGYIGGELDKADRERAERNAQDCLERGKVGHTTTWRNPDNGNHGTFTPTRTYEREGRFCREFTQKIYIGGKTEAQTGVGTACRNPDGSWQIMN